jgi:hypothetical protein
VGAVSTDLLEHVNERAEEGGESVFDLGQLFSSVVPTYLGASRTSPSRLLQPLLIRMGIQNYHSYKEGHSSLRVSSHRLFLLLSPINTSTLRYKCWTQSPLEFPSKCLLFELSTSSSHLRSLPMTNC